MTRHRAIAVLAAAASVVAASAARADVTVTQGSPQVAGAETITFGAAQTGTLLTGATGRSGTAVQVTSTDTLATSGAATVTAADPTASLSNFAFNVPNGAFTGFGFNLGNGVGPVFLAVVANDGVFNFNYDLGAGGTGFAITATNGEILSAVDVAVLGSFSPLGSLDVTLASVPEPASMALLGAGLLGLGLARTRRKEA